MGFFDFLDPSTYQNNGGLLGRLFGADQSQQQPSSIPVGNYQMPIVGPQTQQQPQAAPTQPDIASFLQPQQHSSGLSGLLQGAVANVQGGPLGMIGGAFAGALGQGQGTPQAQATHALLTRFHAIQGAAPDLPQGQAILAAIDPDGAGKAILSNHFGSQGYSFSTLPDGTVIAQNPKTGKVVPVYQATPKADFGIVSENDGSKTYGFIDKNKRTVQPLPGADDDAGGTITGPDGQPIAIPPGVDRSTFRKEVSKTTADAVTGKFTESQAKAAGYAARMETAEGILHGTSVGPVANTYGHTVSSIPFIGGTAATNMVTPESYQKYTQAKDNFIAALLRQESGAAIGKSEYEAADKQYFPQPFDSEGVIQQKAATRKVAVEQMKRSAGPGYKSPVTSSTASDPLGIR